jgi:hypothetical protein
MKISSRLLFFSLIFTLGNAQNCPEILTSLESYQVNILNVQCNTDGSWTCKDGLTGILCNEQCKESIECPGGHYQSQCTPPFQKECLPCREKNVMVTIDSQDQHRNRVQYADLLNGHGSFEDAKLYQDYFTADVALKYTATPTDFEDVLFSSGWKGWSLNSIPLANLAQILFGNGAEESKKMLFVTQGIRLVKEIALHTSNEAPYIVDQGVIKGLLFKLWIRGKNEDTIDLKLRIGLTEINSPTSFLSDKVVTHQFNKDLYEWTEVNGYIDLLGLPDYPDSDWRLPQNLYFRIDIETRSEVFIDEICVYPSWTKNAQFRRWLNTVPPQPHSWDISDGGQQSVESPEMRMGSSVSNYYVSQQIDLSAFPDNVDFPLTLRIEAAYVHETPILKIPYLQVAWYPQGGSREWVVYHELTTEKSTVSAQVKATSLGGRLEVWKHTSSSNGDDTIVLSSVALYADPKSCLVEICTGRAKRGFWNFQCNPCSDTPVYPDAGYKITECILDESGPSYKQESCPVSSTTRYGFFKQESSTIPPCTYNCPSGNWFNRELNSCEECSTYDGNSCDVGSYFSSCVFGGEADSGCKRCETITSHRLQYTVGDTTQSSVCDVECKVGYFQFGLDPNGIPICLPCSESVCGAPDSFRHIPGYQRTTVCNETSNSVCESCIAQDEDYLIYNSSATEIGTDCDYVCKAGYQRCNQQNVFDRRKPLTVLLESQEEALPVNFNTDPGSADVLWVRVSGQLQLNDLRRSYFVTIEHGSQSKRYTPVVDSYHKVLKQPFEFLVQYNALYPVTIHGESTTQPPTVHNLKIETQQLYAPFCERCVPCQNILPGNATWVTGSECIWECRPNFREVNGACILCLDGGCSIGEYWSDCGECSTCPPPPLNAVYIQGTNTFNDSTASCVLACESNFYRDIDGTCKECNQLSCTDTEYLQECTQFSDRLCRSCTKCLPGETVSTPCTTSTDTVCSPCSTVLPYGAHYTGISECDWDCLAPYTRIEELGDSCTECFDICSPGFYFSGACTSENNFTGCEPCTQIPENAIFSTKGLVENMSTSCLWNCPTDLPFLNHSSFRCEPIPYETSSVLTKIQNQVKCTSIFYDHTHECPLGKYFNQTSDVINNPDIETCGSCVDCPEKPDNAIFKLYSCRWECKNPFFRVDNRCVSLESVI